MSKINWEWEGGLEGPKNTLKGSTKNKKDKFIISSINELDHKSEEEVVLKYTSDDMVKEYKFNFSECMVVAQFIESNEKMLTKIII